MIEELATCVRIFDLGKDVIRRNEEDKKKRSIKIAEFSYKIHETLENISVIIFRPNHQRFRPAKPNGKYLDIISRIFSQNIPFYISRYHNTAL